MAMNPDVSRPSSLHLYSDLAKWWPVISAPEDYADEAEFIYQTIMEIAAIPPRTLLELGSGGGNNASHLKKHFKMTLVDLSPEMLEVSKKLNPKCEHIQGDMRTVALDRQFDAVFVHDAVVYMTTLLDLQKVIYTAHDHCRDAGVALFVPDFVMENFKPGTEHGGHDRRKRGARYLSWTYDPDPDDNTYLMEFAFLLRRKDGKIESYYDRHELGLFSQHDWLRLLGDAGFEAKMIRDPYQRFIFAGVKNPV